MPRRTLTLAVWLGTLRPGRAADAVGNCRRAKPHPGRRFGGSVNRPRNGHWHARKRPRIGYQHSADGLPVTHLGQLTPIEQARPLHGRRDHNVYIGPSRGNGVVASDWPAFAEAFPLGSSTSCPEIRRRARAREDDGGRLRCRCHVSARDTSTAIKGPSASDVLLRPQGCRAPRSPAMSRELPVTSSATRAGCKHDVCSDTRGRQAAAPAKRQSLGMRVRAVGLDDQQLSGVPNNRVSSEAIQIGVTAGLSLRCRSLRPSSGANVE